ncbi:MULTISPECIES: rod shape-determining protein MreC [Paenibacillus]|uniref:Cell shape-determining protein MreC n=1 Tax=Paenibacillus baimaensis TaxID=2982185 RepID=A0ABT2UFL4_9BACL|nr:MULTISPECIES: rod shape-determining protein MreC [unclassified Paenibacillus]MCU6793423.1 rod shape-determining protein MreC [Paenibacillus sp. WQ 127069]OMF15675.1 rod shape-determining protein MreC [Paenibacillus sp. FSL H7-0331]
MKLLGNKRLLILLLGFICFIALMGLTLGKRERMSWPEKFVTDTISWTQGIIYKPAGYIAGFFEDIRQVRTIFEENKVLKQTLTKYARDTTKLNDLEQTNKRLQEALNFTERQKQAGNYTFRIAEVVAVNPDLLNNTVSINLGEQDGVKPNMAVMSVDGLVGRVKKVSSFYSTVQTLKGIDDTANESKAISVTVKNKENESFGVIVSYDPGEQLLVMTMIDPNDKLEVGDTVITSGLGQVFPKGIEIGKVVSRKQGNFGISHEALIQPFASFDHLREVFVVIVPEQG